MAAERELGMTASAQLAAQLFGGDSGYPTPTLITEAIHRAADAPAVTLGPATVDSFCERLRESAAVISDHPLIDGDDDIADAFSYLLTAIASGTNLGIVLGDPASPMFSPPQAAHRVDWGGMCPDGVYRQAPIDDHLSYRLSGQIGNADYLSIEMVGGNYRDDASSVLTPDDLQIDGDRHFEIELNGSDPAIPTCAIAPGTRVLSTREFFGNWNEARRSTFRIAPVSVAPPRPHRRHSPQVQMEWDALGEWLLTGAVRFWLDAWHNAAHLETARNAFAGGFSRTGTKRPPVCRGCWDLDPGQMLCIELTGDTVAPWSLQLASALVHTLDFANRLTTFNSTQVERGRDGTVRLLLSHDDPGVYNWLDTTGLRHGELILRLWTDHGEVTPTARVVQQSEARSVIATMPPATPETRATQIARRRDGVMRLICD